MCIRDRLLTAEWEYRLGEIERGQLAPEEFLAGISTCLLYTSAQRSQLLTVMAEAVSDCRTAADQAAELNETGQVGLLRLAEVWSTIRAKEGMGGLVLEGTEAKLLSDVVAQFYAYLSGCMFNDPVGMAIYAELHYMMSSLMLGEWFE